MLRCESFRVIGASKGVRFISMSSENGAVAPVPSVATSKAGCRIRAAKRAFKRFSKKMLGWFLIALGVVLTAAGFLLIIVPGHYFLVVLGLMLILGNSFWARRQFIHLKRRHPNWVMPLRKLLRRKPQIASVFWQQTLKVERFFLRGRGLLVGLRRRLLRRPRTI